jgi:hypothetical protein
MLPDDDLLELLPQVREGRVRRLHLLFDGADVLLRDGGHGWFAPVSSGVSALGGADKDIGHQP